MGNCAAPVEDQQRGMTIQGGIASTLTSANKSESDAELHSGIHLRAYIYSKLSSNFDDDNFLEETKSEFSPGAASRNLALTLTYAL